MNYLWDTGVLIHAVRNSRAYQAINSSLSLEVSGSAPVISIVTVGEVGAFAGHSNWGPPKRKILQDILDKCLIIPIEDDLVTDLYSELAEHSIRNGRNVGQNDLWIAATSIAFNLPLLTTDADFARTKRGSFIRFDGASGAEVARR